MQKFLYRVFKVFNYMISTKSLILKRNKKLVNVNGRIGSNKTQATTAHATSHGLNE